MIYDILEVFKKEYERSGDKLILGKYELKDGLYVKINSDGIFNYFESKTVKKEKVFSTIEGQQDSKAHTWFKEVDYYSSYLNSNKALFDKKIHNINYLSFYFKAENYEYVKKKMREHFLILLSFKKFKDKNEKEILKNYEHQIKSCLRKKDIVKKYRVLEKNFDEIVKQAQELGVKNYIKIFFEEDLELYKQESNIYLSLKIFNDVKFNKSVDNAIYGLSNANMGLNSKKPFLENKSRKTLVPFFIENSDALLVKKFFDWMKLQPYNEDRYLDEHFFMQKQSKNDEAEIKEFEYIPLKKDDVQRHFRPIEVKNYLKVRDKDKKLVKDYIIKELYQLEEKVDELFYNKQLVFNYYNDDIKVSSFMSKELQKLLVITKYSMNNYFRKFDNRSFRNSIQKYGTAFVLDGFRNDRVFKAKSALNLKFSILGEEMDIDEIVGSLDKRLSEDGYEHLSREEFLFLAGQWAYYLLSQSKSRDKTFALAEHYFRAKNIVRLRSTLRNDLKKYKHAINMHSNKIKKTIAMVGSYPDDTNRFSDLEQDMFLVGFSTDNLFYKKKEEKK
jgi:CRISPR-associated protein Csh1